MKKEIYESPIFKFEELHLLEKVADTCWGYKYGWYDENKNGNVDSNETFELGNGAPGGCKKVESMLQEKFPGAEVGVNSQSTIVRPIVS